MIYYFNSTTLFGIFIIYVIKKKRITHENDKYLKSRNL